MLSLNDPRWPLLHTCYGRQSVSVLLMRLLTEAPQPDYGEPHPTLWEEVMSELEHQGTIYPATIAAFPFLVQAVARVAPARRAYWLGMLAFLVSGQRAQNLQDPDGQVTPALSAAFEQAIQDVVPLAVESVLTGATFGDSERSAAAMLALVAFARGESRLGFILAEWWPYGKHPGTKSLVPMAVLEKYEDMTGDVRDPL